MVTFSVGLGGVVGGEILCEGIRVANNPFAFFDIFEKLNRLEIERDLQNVVSKNFSAN